MRQKGDNIIRDTPQQRYLAFISRWHRQEIDVEIVLLRVEEYQTKYLGDLGIKMPNLGSGTSAGHMSFPVGRLISGPDTATSQAGALD